ncbi:MAG TPA: chromosome partitioning protein ParA [Lachnospiraceae bacterium]|nr:chromosome partitioning protein ParA [Lachnospiraceae bacterium]
MAKVIVVANQKGGCSKTSVVTNLSIGLAMEGRKVCVIDADPQGSLTASLGYQEPDAIRYTLATIMTKIINEEEIDPSEGILHHEEGVDLVPSNIELSGMEVSLANAMSRELILKEYVDLIRDQYDYILIDCMPSLGVMTINALVAADRVLIPVQAAYLPVKGLQQLLKTVMVVKKRLNKDLEIEGILITMVDYRTNYAKDITEMLRENYGDSVGIMKSYIPFSVKVAEASAEGSSIYCYAPRCKVAESFEKLTMEVLENEE